MADFIATARSNYFRVKDTAAFLAIVAKTDMDTFEGTGEDEGKFALECSSVDHGGWPSSYWDNTQEDEDVDFDIVDFLKEHLADGEVAVLMEVGAEKMRYLGGWSLAFDNTDRPLVRVDIDDIYRQAEAAFGVTALSTASL